MRRELRVVKEEKMGEERELTVEKLAQVEQALVRYESITQARLGYGLGRNLTIDRRIMDDVRKRLEGSEAIKQFNQKRLKILQGGIGKQVSELEEAIEHLKDEMGVREELEDLRKREEEILKEKELVTWRRVSLATEPGFGKDDVTATGVLSMADRRLFLEVGILYDPDEEAAEGAAKE
jgi:hypothetical protein